MDNIKKIFKKKPMEKKYYSLKGMIWRFLLLSFVNLMVSIVFCIITYLFIFPGFNLKTSPLYIYNYIFYDIPWVFLTHIFLLTSTDGQVYFTVQNFNHYVGAGFFEGGLALMPFTIILSDMSFFLTRINFFFIFIFFNNYLVRRIVFSLYSLWMGIIWHVASSFMDVPDEAFSVPKIVPFSIDAFINHTPLLMGAAVVSFIIIFFLPRSLFNFHWKVTEKTEFIIMRPSYIFGILFISPFVILSMILLKAYLIDILS